MRCDGRAESKKKGMSGMKGWEGEGYYQSSSFEKDQNVLD
jgi:hypothetical protein